MTNTKDRTDATIGHTPESVIETGTDDLLGRKIGHVAVLTFNRPERRNALSGGVYVGFENALPAIANDPDIRVLMLTGAGGAFCAGGDVKAMAAAHATGKPLDPVVRMETQRISHRNTSLRLYEMSIP
ncbi:MAG: enoyl-CoA hydratase/isomerase family protein, partial [Acidimicrobiales bacterium]